ncbi:hypothetical protein pipiens_006519 [Culex pipiens pipiens]|uniref:Uncharacterized protein n=1 Tax=Culex pipiens pipiens TaxID=38569 RepID=A0ABD1DP52_CULPP
MILVLDVDGQEQLIAASLLNGGRINLMRATRTAGPEKFTTQEKNTKPITSTDWLTRYDVQLAPVELGVRELVRIESAPTVCRGPKSRVPKTLQEGTVARLRLRAPSRKSLRSVDTCKRPSVILGVAKLKTRDKVHIGRSPRTNRAACEQDPRNRTSSPDHPRTSWYGQSIRPVRGTLVF